MELIVVLIVLIGGIVAGIYWHRAVDVPRQKEVKKESCESVIIDVAEQDDEIDD